MDWDLNVIVANIPALVFNGYADGSIDLFDDKVEAMLGYGRGEFDSRRLKWTDLIVPEDRAAARTAVVEALRTSGRYTREYRVLSRAGQPTWIHERSQIIRGTDGRIERITGLFFDITERKYLEAAVAERTAELQQANGRLAAWAADLEHRNSEINVIGQMGDLLQSCNDTAEAYSGLPGFLTRLFAGTSGALFALKEADRPVEAQVVWGPHPPEEREFPLDHCWGLRRGRAHGRSEIEAGFRCRHVDGSAVYVCTPMAAHGSALGLLHVVLDSPDPQRWDDSQALAGRVAEHLALALAKLRLQETLQHLSVRDGLTGLFNRRYLEATLTRELKQAERQDRPLGIMMIDIDHFKRYNDRLGHDAGDAVLRAIGSLLQQHIRSSDIACRYGGEEFTVVLQDASLEITQARAETIRAAAEQMMVTHGERSLAGVTLSLGVASFPAQAKTPELLLQAADTALYRAKDAGRNRVCAAETV